MWINLLHMLCRKHFTYKRIVQLFFFTLPVAAAIEATRVDTDLRHRTVVLIILQHGFFQTVSKRHHNDDRRNADYHAKHCKHRPQLSLPQVGHTHQQ